jgi:methyl-accepting chemotaxis protein
LEDNFAALNDGKTVVDSEVYTDKWGSWISGSAPFYDSNGKLVGAMGLDFRADYVQQVQTRILDQVVVAFAVTYGALFILVFFVARALTQPIRKFARLAQVVGEGDYDDIDDLNGLKRGIWRDETNALAEIFSEMINKVRQRETELKRRVNELKIKIDQSKASEQVREIVDTDFFEHLTARASDIRSRKRNPVSSPVPESDGTR